MKFLPIIICAIALISTACTNNAPQPAMSPAFLATPQNDPVVYSFAFMGCNRVDRSNITDPSTADTAAFNRIIADMLQQTPKPQLFFLLGDLVLGESTTAKLDYQLGHWVHYIQQSALANAGIEIVALPGNHEMLTYQRGARGEVPLDGATDIWLQHMAPYMPADRDTISGDSAAVNRMTFAFKRNGIGFILMNTDTYNDAAKEGKIAKDWIVGKMRQYQAEPVKQLFVLSHKPAVVNGQFRADHSGFPDSKALWQELDAAGAIALLSAHVHNYQRSQPANSKVYQVIAGNGGSPLDPSGVPSVFYGYSMIRIYQSGKVVVFARGYAPEGQQMRLQDSLLLR